MWKAMLDKSGAYSKLSAKSRAEFTAEHPWQCSYRQRGLLEVYHFCVPNICPCTKYPNLQRAIKQCQCEGILTELRELE